MEEIYQELFCLFIFIVTGVIVSILFDIFRILRRSFKTADWLTCLQDILFWILAGFVILFSILKFNNGEIRSYIFFGIALGILLYMLVFSKFIVKYSVIVINAIKKILSYPIHFLQYIFSTLVVRPIKSFIHFMQKKLQKGSKTDKKQQNSLLKGLKFQRKT